MNSLHSQAIDQLAPGLSVEAVAEDGTVEAVSGPGTAGFCAWPAMASRVALSAFPASVAIFGAFGEACRQYRLAAGTVRGVIRPVGGLDQTSERRDPSTKAFPVGGGHAFCETP